MVTIADDATQAEERSEPPLRPWWRHRPVAAQLGGDEWCDQAHMAGACEHAMCDGVSLSLWPAILPLEDSLLKTLGRLAASRASAACLQRTPT